MSHLGNQRFGAALEALATGGGALGERLCLAVAAIADVRAEDMPDHGLSQQVRAIHGRATECLGVDDLDAAQDLAARIMHVAIELDRTLLVADSCERSPRGVVAV